MSDYVYESGLSTKRRRQRRTAITLLLTVLLLFGAFWWAWSYIRDGDTSAAPGPAPTAGACDSIADPREVTINVYNATRTSGLAARVSNDLRDRGFTIGAVSNDPVGADIPQAAQLRYGDTGRPYAAIFKTIVPEPDLRPDGREDDSVDFVIGTGFTELSASPAGLPAC